MNEISERARAILLEQSVAKQYDAGDVLWTEGDEANSIVLVLEGTIRIVRTAAGRQTVIHSGSSGNTLGEVPFFTKGKYPATAIAVERTRCLLISYSALAQALTVDPSLAFYLLEKLSLRIESLVDRLARLSAHTVQSRLAAFILQRAYRTPRTEQGGPFSLGMTQAQLAEELGTVREVVVRSLRSLRQSGAIAAVGEGRYRVADMDVLKQAIGTEA